MKKLIFTISFLILIFPGILFSGVLNGITAYSVSNVVAAGDAGLIMRSNTSGISWQELNFPGEDFKSISFAGNKILTGTGSGKLFIFSTNDSLSLLYSFSPQFTISSIFFINSAKGFLCGSNGFIYKTDNGGINWSLINSGIGSVNLNSILFITETNGFAAGNGGRIFFTSDAGLNWISETSNTQSDILKLLHINNTTFACGKSGLLLSGSSGWSVIDTKTKSDIRSMAVSSDNIVHICGGGGFIRNNKFNTEFQNFEPNPCFGELSDIVFFNDRGWAVNSSNKAILRTADNGVTWSFPSNISSSFVWVSKVSGLNYAITNTFCINPKNHNSVFSMYSNKIYATYDKGETFALNATVNIFDSCNAASFIINPADTNIWMAAVYNINLGYVVIRSVNHGADWNVVLDSIEFGISSTPLEINSAQPQIVYFADKLRGFFRSTDYGATFSSISSYAFKTPYDIITKRNDPLTILIADASHPSNDSSGLLKSTDGGFTWQVKFKVSYNEISSFSENPFNPSEIYFIAEKIYKSNNFGDSWEARTTPIVPLWAFDVCREDPNSLIGGVYFPGPNLISTNAGNTFQYFNNPTNYYTQPGIVYPEKNYAIAMFNKGIYKLVCKNNVVVGISENLTIVPDGFRLYQNYPNPFNPITNVKFDIYKEGLVTLKIFDLNGKEISTLLKSNLKSGTYEIPFEGINLSSGVYFYKIILNDMISDSRKMVLLK